MQILETDQVLDSFFGRLDGRQTGALILDYDGTLAPFCKDRLSALPYSGVSQAMYRMMQGGHTRVVVVTGRPVEEVTALLGIFPIPEIWGLYGLQHLTSDGECRIFARFRREAITIPWPQRDVHIYETVTSGRTRSEGVHSAGATH